MRKLAVSLLVLAVVLLVVGCSGNEAAETKSDATMKASGTTTTENDSITDIKETTTTTKMVATTTEKSYAAVEKMTLKFSYLSITGYYTGDIKNNIPDGKGTFSYNGKVLFEGEFINGSPIKESFMEYCSSGSYEDIARDPDARKGESIKITGMVVQVLEGNGKDVEYRIKTGTSDVFYIFYTRSDGEQRILENDTVDIFGICEGVVTYDSTLGGKITIPAMLGLYLERK
ncbi:MAG: hypothetical protein FWE80_01940 [Oscillospiraceae bacterium]|nr:hypothetical protein [Oscillospiraceae bacterium]